MFLPADTSQNQQDDRVEASTAREYALLCAHRSRYLILVAVVRGADDVVAVLLAVT